MSFDAIGELEQARAQLVQDGCCSEDWLAHTLLLAALFERTSHEQHRGMIAEFHNQMGEGRLPYVGESDVGALILEVQADKLQDPVVKEFLYIEAQFRATWCAQHASSGGEGLARSLHLRRLERKLAKVRSGTPG
jgi:hypothetical protein